MFIGKYNKAVSITFLGVLSSMIGIYAILGFAEPRIEIAMICLIAAGICDMFDGKIARKLKNRTNEDEEYGIQLDSLADTICFIVFPIVTLYGMSKYFSVDLHPILTVVVVALFAVAGITRLSYFNLVAFSATGPVKHYTGLPVTMTSCIFPLTYLLRYVLSPNVFVGVYLAWFALIALLFVLNFKLPKPKKNWWYATCCVMGVIVSSLLLYMMLGS